MRMQADCQASAVKSGARGDKSVAQRGPVRNAPAERWWPQGHVYPVSLSAVRGYFAWTAAALLVVTAGCSERASHPDPNNELPFGVIDSPRSGQVVGRTVEVAGWALDDSRVGVVNVYVDGKFKASGQLTIARPDVSKALPKYARREENPDLHGWHTTVDLGETPGTHTILAQAVDDRGATRDIGSLTVDLIGRQ